MGDRNQQVTEKSTHTDEGKNPKCDFYFYFLLNQQKYTDFLITKLIDCFHVNNIYIFKQLFF